MAFLALSCVFKNSFPLSKLNINLRFLHMATAKFVSTVLIGYFNCFFNTGIIFLKLMSKLSFKILISFYFSKMLLNSFLKKDSITGLYPTTSESI
jgi:hypothetical protein